MLRKKTPAEEAERVKKITNEAKRDSNRVLAMSVFALIVVILINLDKVLPFLN